MNHSSLVGFRSGECFVSSSKYGVFTIDILGEAVDGPGEEVVILELVLVGVLPTGGELTLQRQDLYVLIGS